MRNEKYTCVWVSGVSKSHTIPIGFRVYHTSLRHDNSTPPLILFERKTMKWAERTIFLRGKSSCVYILYPTVDNKNVRCVFVVVCCRVRINSFIRDNVDGGSSKSASFVWHYFVGCFLWWIYILVDDMSQTNVRLLWIYILFWTISQTVMVTYTFMKVTSLRHFSKQNVNP